tara:strand:+ start:373 stop:537 length:165 start_codon:yes stop_codon:yes gene_type:complete
MIYPKRVKKKDLINAISYLNNYQISTIYRLLIEFDSNAETNDIKEFIRGCNNGK